jgi:hypothetical protein
MIHALTHFLVVTRLKLSAADQSLALHGESEVVFSIIDRLSSGYGAYQAQHCIGMPIHFHSDSATDCPALVADKECLSNHRLAMCRERETPGFPVLRQRSVNPS